MSYDLLVFDPASAPGTPAALREWYDEVVRWAEGHDYADAANCAPLLQAWYRDIIIDFPALNGPDRPTNFGDIPSWTLTDYSCARHAIYVGFARGVPGYKRARHLCEKHRIGLLEASEADGKVLGPTEGGGYGLLFRLA